jgi:hypothetical protein
LLWSFVFDCGGPELRFAPARPDRNLYLSLPGPAEVAAPRGPSECAAGNGTAVPESLPLLL